jgi:hypothetical protein
MVIIVTVYKLEYRMYKLSVEVATGEVALTKLPVPGRGKPLLRVTRDGKLAVASVYHAHVTARTQQAGAGDGGVAAAEAWPHTCSFRIPPAVPYPNISLKWQPKEEWCNFSRGSMLVLYRSGGAFFVDLHKKVMEKVMDYFLPPSWVVGVMHGKSQEKWLPRSILSTNRALTYI